jgi:hypothetical protein
LHIGDQVISSKVGKQIESGIKKMPLFGGNKLGHAKNRNIRKGGF